MSTRPRDNPLFGYVSLFTSLGTLICCALPSLLVLLGLGATVASVLSAAPWLATPSHHKSWIFVLAGTALGGNFVSVYHLWPRRNTAAAACSGDDPSACGTASRVSRVILWLSAGLYLLGFSVAYVLRPILVRFGS